MLNEYKIKVLTNTNQDKPIAITVFTENILTEKNLNDLSEMTLDEVRKNVRNIYKGSIHVDE